MYTNPKMKYRGNLNKDRLRWTKTCRAEGCLWKVVVDFNVGLGNRPLQLWQCFQWTQEVAWFASCKTQGIEHGRKGCRSLVGCSAWYGLEGYRESL